MGINASEILEYMANSLIEDRNNLPRGKLET